MNKKRPLPVLMILLGLFLLAACASHESYMTPLKDSGLAEMVSNIPAKRFND